MEARLIETPRLILRRWKKEDLLPFRKINSDPRVMEFYPSLLSAAESDEVVERAERHFEKRGFGLWATELEVSGEFIGFVGLQNFPLETHFSPAVEIGWRIAKEHWNQGYATEAAKHALDFGFQSIHLKEVVAMTYEGNLRSRRVMEKLGMTYDPQDDFLHPNPALEDHRLAPHVLYRARYTAP